MRIKFYFLWLSLVCIVFFILQINVSGFTELGVLNQEALHGEYWRFVTAIFLHGGVEHLVYNLFALLFFGFALESLVGSRKFLLIFFGSGILANMVSINFYSSSLGASGAIMGLIGAVAIIRPFMMVWAFGLILPAIVAAFIWIIGDIIGAFIPNGVGNVAHLSGIAIGILCGILLKGKRRKKSKIRIPDSYMRAWEDRHMR